MKSKRIFLAALLGTSFFANAQTPLPYSSGFDTPAEKAGWTEYKLGVNSDPYKWEYSSFSAFSAPECLTHFYPVGGSQQTDDWFVSPQFDFSSGAVLDSLQYVFSGFGTPQPGDTIAIYLINGSADPSLATSKQMLYSFTDSTYMNDNVWRQISAVQIPAISGQSHLAFRYSTVVNWLDTRLDDLRISGQGIGRNEFSRSYNVDFFPNPTGGILNLKYSENLDISRIEILSTTGLTVANYPENLKVLKLQNLPAGHYILRFYTADGIILKKFAIL